MKGNMEELQSLVTRTQGGDLDAYGLIVRRFQDMAYAYAFSMLGDFHQAQDAAQNAFIQAYQEIGSLRESVAFPGWFRRIVYTECAMMTRRKCVPSVSLDSVVDVASCESGPAEMAERRELARRVQTAIRELPDAQRVVTTLFYINGYSHQDIAEFLEVPAKTVKSRLHASRGRLRERMIDMVEDQLKANKLPEQFAKETVDQAVARAKALNKESKYNEAEDLLRQVLAKAPENPDVLKELNRSLMQGRVYGQGRFEKLREVVDYGRTILQTIDDEDTRRQFAKTLLAIPAMPEAVEFLNGWIAKDGPNLERLGMLAWAKGCTADYDGAENVWRDVLALAQEAEPNEVRRHVPFIAKTLVNCFAEAGELARAQRVVQETWERCHELPPSMSTSQIDLISDLEWIGMFREAGLDFEGIARTFLARHQGDSLEDRAIALGIRSLIDDPQSIVAAWLDWVGERFAAGQYTMPRDHYGVEFGLRARGFWQLNLQLANATWALLEKANAQEAEAQRRFWQRQRLDTIRAAQAHDWATVEALIARQMEESGIELARWSMVHMAMVRGTSVPREAVEYVAAKDMAAHDSYDWYVVAREAAAAGDQSRAFGALRNALDGWCNPPHFYTKTWEDDPFWGELRNHPEFRAAFEEKRKRIGPVYGSLFYFPGW